jgi:hypothetical protein
MLSDTLPEAQRVLAQVYRQMSMERKAAIVDDLHQITRRLFEAGVRARDPEASDEKILDQYMRQTMCRELYEAVRRHRDGFCQRLARTAAGAHGA